MLHEFLHITPGVTAVIGGGGKTTLLHTLAETLPGSVILCTTTRIYPPPHLALDPDISELPQLLQKNRIICAARPAENGKLQSPTMPPETLAKFADYVLVEADGSKHLPLKAHLIHEPVIPAGCENVICVVGADCFGKPAKEVCHRPERFTELTGEETVSFSSAAKLLETENFHTRVFLNKAELGDFSEFSQYLTCPAVAGSLKEGWYRCLR